MNLLLLYFHPTSIWCPEFRIYLSQDASDTDVRLSGRGEPYRGVARLVLAPGVPLAEDGTTAYDRCDDRRFPEDDTPF